MDRANKRRVVYPVGISIRKGREKLAVSILRVEHFWNIITVWKYFCKISNILDLSFFFFFFTLVFFFLSLHSGLNLELILYEELIVN